MQETSAAEQGLRAQLEEELGAVREGLQGSQADHAQVWQPTMALCWACRAARLTSPWVGAVAVHAWTALLVCNIVLGLHSSLIENVQVWHDVCLDWPFSRLAAHC